jgi:hypothetical protein
MRKTNDRNFSKKLDNFKEGFLAKPIPVTFLLRYGFVPVSLLLHLPLRRATRKAGKELIWKYDR